MADVVSAERANVVNEGVVKDAESQSKSTLRSSSTAVTGRASALGDGKTRHSLGNDPAGLRGSAKVARRDGIAPAPGSVAYSNGKASNETITDESGVGRPSAKSGKPSPTTAGIFKIGAVDAGAGAAEAAAAPAGRAASAAGKAASTATVGTATASAAAPVAGVIAGVLAFVIGVLLVSQMVSALFGFWENEAMKDTGQLTGIEAEIAAALKGYGFSNEATAAILGNLKAESGMDPASDSNMDGQFNYAYERACGIFQYTSTSPGTGEYWAFKRWCSANGKTWSTVEAQMEWTFSGNCEGTWSSRWGTALARSGYYSNCPGYTDGAYYVAGGFKEADDVVKATYSWMACYERPANGQYAHLDRRIEYAKEYLDKLTSPAASYSGSNKIIAAAYSQLGVPYVWGGSIPGVGLDCSGLTQYCYAQAGVSIAHYTETQYEQLTVVPLSQAQPGDILYKPGHVAIFIGDDQYIHEPQTGDVCKISTGIGYFSCALRYTG
ncbi:phage tail tip lysozyme [Gordonibacter sp. Marseille-P4307]|uniref:phage tail tip lysozyme n=1 Tax=Gordonibacter sp. Marseille-P4307 TaxID=2161815 RepID=UPI001F14E354|nr:phage tail tip lysozyme [Gordonibacter sp. Marseille-P4307]